MLKAEDVFFFDQYKPKRFETRRAKNKEGITFRPGEKETADSASVFTSKNMKIFNELASLIM